MYKHVGRSDIDSVIDGLPGGLEVHQLLRTAIERWGTDLLEPFKLYCRESLTSATQKHKKGAQYNALSGAQSGCDQLVFSKDFVPVPLVGAWGTPIDVPEAFEIETQGFARFWRADNTLRRRFSSWKKILRLCLDADVCPLPMSAGTAAGIVSKVAASGLSYAEVRSVRECITFVHVYKNFPDPTRDVAFARVWAGISRVLTTESKNAKIALSRHEIAEMIDIAISHRRPDLAVAFAVCFEGALRASDACMLRMEHVMVQNDRIKIYVRGKTAQFGEGRWLPLELRENAPFNASAMVIDWIRSQDRTTGYLLSPVRDGHQVDRPLDPRTLNRMIKLYGQLIAEPIAPHKLGSHSFRAGWATDELDLGRADAAVAYHLRHKQLATLLKYYRPRVRQRNFVRYASAGKLV